MPEYSASLAQTLQQPRRHHAFGRHRQPNHPPAAAKRVSATNEESTSDRPTRYPSAMRLARLFEWLPLGRPNGGANLRIIALLADATPVEPIPTHIGEPPRPPPDQLPRTIHPNRHRTGTLSLSPNRRSNPISVSPPGNHRLLPEVVTRALVLPRSGMTPSPASACDGRRARSVRQVSGP